MPIVIGSRKNSLGQKYSSHQHKEKILNFSSVIPLGSKPEKATSDEQKACSSPTSSFIQTISAKLKENNKAECNDMSSSKSIYKELVTTYMSRIGNVFMCWLIATLVISLMLTMFT